VEAERHLAAYVKDDARSQLPAVTVPIVLDLYLADRRARERPGADRLAMAHKALARHMATLPADGLTDAVCLSYKAKRRAEGVTDSTVRTELQALRAALRWAAEPKAGLIAVAPKLLMPSRPPARERWLSRDEGARLLDACKAKHLRLFVAIALNTAARSGAILGLTWDRVDLENRRIDFREPGKVATRKKRVPVPINDTLAAALEVAKERATSRFVVEFAGGQVASIKHGFHTAAVRAGLADVSPHTCRHTAATWMAQAGVPLWQVAGMLGHSDAAMVAATYGHHHPDHMAEAARALG
jgi:integrase